jgi:hypothetical protein
VVRNDQVWQQIRSSHDQPTVLFGSIPIGPTTQRIVQAVKMSPSVKKTLDGSFPSSTASARSSSRAFCNCGRQYVSGTQTMRFSFARTSISTPYPSPHLIMPPIPTCLSASRCGSVVPRSPCASGWKGSESTPHGIGISASLPQSMAFHPSTTYCMPRASKATCCQCKTRMVLSVKELTRSPKTGMSDVR